MECKDVKNNISAYLDHELDLKLNKEVEIHLGSCPSCFQASQQMSRTWQLLDLAPSIEPSAHFVSRFWTKAAIQESAFERFLRGWANLVHARRFIPVATVLSLMLIIGSTGVIQEINMHNQFNQIKPDDIEMLQNLDIAEHFETISDLDLTKNPVSNMKEGSS